MARTTIKATYSLDPQTVRQLEGMARRLGVSKSEALRRAIRSAAVGDIADEREQALAALRQLRRSMNLDAAAADEWTRSVRDERRSSAQRREPPGS